MVIYDPTWRVDKVDKSEIDGFTMSNIYYSTPMLEYNMFMTIFSNFKDIINSVATDYGLDWEIDIIPEFPKDLTKIHFPSVCIREVSVNKSALITGNPIEIEDDENGVILDSMTRKHKMLIQYDAVAKTNGQRLQLKSLVDETIARMSSMTLINFNNKVHKNLPTVFGETIYSDGDAYSENFTVDTLEYVGITRQSYYCNEIIIPRDNNEIIDLLNLYLIHADYLDYDGSDYSVSEHNIYSFRPIYNNMKKIKKYLYEIDYNDIDEDVAREYFETKRDLDMFACSAIRKGNFFGRNYDWVFNEQAEFIVRVPKSRKRNASISICGLTGITDNMVRNIDSTLLKVLPFSALDGINEYGVVCNINVVPLDKQPTTYTVPHIETRDTICSMQVVRYVLDNFSTAREAVEYIRDYVRIYMPKTLQDMHYECHFMVADETDTFVIEFIDNDVNIIEDATIMTNFYLTDVEYNSDGLVYTPYSQNGELNAIEFNKITRHGSGLERYNIAKSVYDTLETEEDMITLMDTLKYSNSYKDVDNSRFWFTEFVDGDLTCASSVNDFSDMKQLVINAWDRKVRNENEDGVYGLWHTTHSIVYDIPNRSFVLEVQEDNEKLRYSLL